MRNTPIQEELHAWATRLAERMTGLMEPLKIVEIDQPLGKASTQRGARNQRRQGVLLRIAAGTHDPYLGDLAPLCRRS